MIKISKMADYSVVILAQIHINDGVLMSASELSLRTKLTEPTVAKLLKQLCRAEIIRSVRGVNGGYTLIENARNVTVEDIISAVDGPVMITACSDGAEPDCALIDCCSVRGRWDDVNKSVCEVLRSVTLADMVEQEKTGKVA